MTAVLNPKDFPDAQPLNGSQKMLGVGDSNLPQPNQPATASPLLAAATNLPDAQTRPEGHVRRGVGDQTTETAHCTLESHALAGGLGSNFPDAHTRTESHGSFGAGDSNLPQPRRASLAKIPTAAATNLPDAQDVRESQFPDGVGEPNLPQPIPPSLAKTPPAAATNLPDAHLAVESQSKDGVGDQAGTETAHCMLESHVVLGGLGPILRDPTLAMAADVVDDLERVKIANQNRLRTLTMDGEFGHGLSLEHPDVQRLANLVKALEDADHQATLNLGRVMRYHPLGAFVKNSKGVGEKQAARLLAAIGDPYWNDLHNRPRKLRELYAFCGMSVVGTSAQQAPEGQKIHGAGSAPTKQRGERVTWSPDARMRLWLIASKCVMVGHGGPYRAVYDEGRIKYADAIHAEECKRCGPKGKPALVGSPLSAAHQHARAIRLIAKAILRDLWAEAKRIHEEKELSA